MYRVPDWTVKIDGKPVAGDNKFSGDSFGNRLGKRSGYTQLEDQNQMNEDQHPGKKDYQNLHLNPAKCKCDKENPARETVTVTVPSLGTVAVPLVAPGATFPSPVVAPGSVPIELPGGLIPAF